MPDNITITPSFPGLINIKTQQKRVLQVGGYSKSILYSGTSEAEHHKGKLPLVKAEAKVCAAEGFWSVFRLGIRVSHAATLHRSTCIQAVHAISHPWSPCHCTVQIPGSPCCIASTRSEAGDPPGWPQVRPHGKASFQRAMFPARCLYLGGAALADLEGQRGAVSGRRKCSTEQK